MQPSSAERRRTPASGAKKLMFGVAALCCFALFLVLISMRKRQGTALSGELLADGGTPADPGLIEGLFDYFGMVTYLSPLLILYLCHALIFRRPTLSGLDFFKLGFVVLGFNSLILGLCAIFSSFFALRGTGGGGILGDFLNLLLYAVFPRFLAVGIPLFVAVAGLFLFLCSSPVAAVDRIGAALWGLFPSRPGKSQQDQPAPQKREGLGRRLEAVPQHRDPVFGGTPQPAAVPPGTPEGLFAGVRKGDDLPLGTPLATAAPTPAGEVAAQANPQPVSQAYPAAPVPGADHAAPVAQPAAPAYP
ncbi:MAG: hypothetical protein K6A65_01465, partial [Succinivibrionaceae bacterium]|nr:hypothetical protein [Succinivibrionaceae bacterium]